MLAREALTSLHPGHNISNQKVIAMISIVGCEIISKAVAEPRQLPRGSVQGPLPIEINLLVDFSKYL